MDRKLSTANAAKRTPLAYGDLQVPLMMWSDIPAQKISSRIPTPMHPRIVGLGAALLIGAFATDLEYARSELFQWENFSVWLITAGLLFAAVAAFALVFDAVLRRAITIDWPRFCGFTAAVLLSVLNAFVHSRDAYTAVVPQGVILSGVVAVILLALGWRNDWSVGKAPRPLSQTEGTHS
jgi:uncharacterized membrane protein